MKSSTIIWLVFFVLLSVQGNTLEQPEEYSDPSRPIEVKVGQTFIIVLECNKSNGFCWKFAKDLDGAVLEYVSSKYIPDSALVLGTVGQEKWTFRARGSGKAEISLKYIAPWDKHSQPMQKKRFLVIVR